MTTTTRTDVLDVLIIDDDPELAHLVEAALARHETQQFEVRRATCATDGIDAYDLQPADLVVLDLGLPDSSRADPLRVLRELMSRHPSPCVVVLTGHAWGLGRQAMRMGAQDYLDKGEMSPAQLRDAVVFAVERHAHTTRNASISALARADGAASQPGQPGGADRLRTPLATLTRALEQMRREPGLPAVERADLLDQALRASYALGGQLDQVVAAQRRLLGREAVDLTALATELVGHLAELTEAVGAHIDVHELPRVWGQPQPLRLLLRNLTLNALQHGGPGVHVRIASQPHPRGIRLLVEDSGPGIPAGERADLFDLTGPAGRGFGLRACAAVASAHGGRCWVEDSPLGGARVIVELPARRRVE